jgi:hypothetical protein
MKDDYALSALPSGIEIDLLSVLVWQCEIRQSLADRRAGWKISPRFTPRRTAQRHRTIES